MRTALIVMVLLAGCSKPPQRPSPQELCELYSQVAYEVVKAEASEEEQAPASCCGKCNGTGKVRSGDGLSIVPCPCPPTCPCKAKK